MRISDWSSDVCSSDLESEGDRHRHPDRSAAGRRPDPDRRVPAAEDTDLSRLRLQRDKPRLHEALAGGVPDRVPDRKRVVEGKGAYVGVELGGRRLSTKKEGNRKED